MIPFAALDRSDFLREWHARYPGTTSATFWYGRIDDDGRSSYDLLVDDVAALTRARSVVDLACGDGYLLARLSQRLPDATLAGIDMTPEELDLARRRTYEQSVELFEARVEALPLRDQTIDAVVSHMALMLFDDAPAATAEIARVLRPGGMFAAVLGPAPGSSDLAISFGAKLHEIEAAENLPPLQIGDPATHAEDSLRALFENNLWRSVELHNLHLRFQGSDERIVATLLGMYNVARLSENGRAALSQHLTSDLQQRHRLGQPADCVLGLRHLVASRATWQPGIQK